MHNPGTFLPYLLPSVVSSFPSTSCLNVCFPSVSLIVYLVLTNQMPSVKSIDNQIVEILGSLKISQYGID